ncbi:MAG TPA: hypothetical protein VMR70_21410 [Flavisolibacter sp.]|nr:hypothetical protein [Flavisolibacter sp.]
MKPFNTLSFVSFFLFFSFSLFTGCRKADTIPELKPPTENYRSLQEQFFNAANADPEVQKVAANIKRQDDLFKFLPQFVKKNGIPRWDKTVYKTTAGTGSRNANARSNADGSQGVFFIPLQAEGSSQIKSYITAYKHGDSLYTYRLYNRDSINAIQTQSSQQKSNLINTQAVFAAFEKSVNGVDSVTIQAPVNGKIKNATINIKPASQTASGRNSDANRTTNCVMSLEVSIEYSLEVTVDGNTIYIYESVSVVMEITIDCSGGGGGGGCGCQTIGTPSGDPSGGTGSGGNNYWWNYGTGWPWYNTWGTYDPNNVTGWYWWWTGGGYSGNGSGFSPTVDYLTNSLGLSWNQSYWLSQNPDRANELYNFTALKFYSDLSEFDKADLARAFLDKLMTDTEFAQMMQEHSIYSVTMHPWMLELFKELAVEIGLKIIRKYLPAYGDWQSIKDAIDNGAHGDWLGVLGEVLNVVKKKVPWTAVPNAIYDIFDFGEDAKRAFDVFRKITDLPADAAKGLLKTLKTKAGGILNKIEIDPNSTQGFGRILHNPNDAPDFFDDFARNVTGNLPGTFTPQNGGIGKYFSFGGVSFNFYTNPTSGGGPTIDIQFPGGYHYKFRFQ